MGQGARPARRGRNPRISPPGYPPGHTGTGDNTVHSVYERHGPGAHSFATKRSRLLATILHVDPRGGSDTAGGPGAHRVVSGHQCFDHECGRGGGKSSVVRAALEN
ncbi:hypothetical protein D3C87_1378520 [compost metagenome]